MEASDQAGSDEPIGEVRAEAQVAPSDALRRATSGRDLAAEAREVARKLVEFGTSEYGPPAPEDYFVVGEAVGLLLTFAAELDDDGWCRDELEPIGDVDERILRVLRAGHKMPHRCGGTAWEPTT